MFTSKDLESLKSKGLTQVEIEQQLDDFKKGFPYLKIEASATIDKGILKVKSQDRAKFIETWDNYLQQKKEVLKFVPASGAASRMFKDLFSFLSASYSEPTTAVEVYFFDNINRFAFYKDLNEVCLKKHDTSVIELINKGEYKKIVSSLLLSEGLNYGKLPKALLKFHTYGQRTRTAFEEHLSEGALYAKNSKGNVNIHFTVSPEHEALFRSLLDKKKNFYENSYSVHYNVGFSVQKSNTDTIAVDANNEPFRENGELVFRPGGHGALIHNLNDLDADIIFIKNIDNVVSDALKGSTIIYKKLLAGILVAYQEQIFAYLAAIEVGQYDHEKVLEMVHFLQNELNVRHHDLKNMEDGDLILYIKDKLMRPIRVCGMVRNVGEPGGGPFFAVNPDESVSLQILESSQIDMENPEAKAIFEQGTHFNPVDLVCGVKNHKGEKYDLLQFVDPATGFISIKSKDGQELKALELPGLWNGAMSNWNTVFVEVPIETFNPVKTVNDLLRPEHQA
ncbi:MAG: DUF4301 family protein [Tannerellaceae bacterium]